MQKPTGVLVSLCMLVALLPMQLEAAPYPREEMAVLLLPISTRPVVGSRGQNWWADIRAHNTADHTVPFHQGAEFCGVPLCVDGITAGQTRKLEMGAPSNGWPGQGQLAYVNPGDADKIVFQNHVLVSAGSVERIVAELPAIGESELLQSGVLPYITVSPSGRISLRVYDVSPNTPSPARVRIYSSRTRELLIDELVPLSYDEPRNGDAYDFPEFPGYLQLDDLAIRYPRISNETAVRIDIEMIEPSPSLWFFASITSADDESVVLYTPDSAK